MTLDQYIENIEDAVFINQCVIDSIKSPEKAQVMQKRNDERSQLLGWLKDYKRLIHEGNCE